MYRFTMAFGLKANPGTILPYHQIVDGDYYVDDGNSRYYNKLANTKQVQEGLEFGGESDGAGAAVLIMRPGAGL